MGLNKHKKIIHNVTYREFNITVSGLDSEGAQKERLSRIVGFWHDLHSISEDTINCGDLNRDIKRYGDKNFSSKDLIETMQDFKIDSGTEHLVNEVT